MEENHATTHEDADTRDQALEHVLREPPPVGGALRVGVNDALADNEAASIVLGPVVVPFAQVNRVMHQVPRRCTLRFELGPAPIGS